eukprot:3686141-Alexandrium_andersonii.AAC.1
MSASLVGSEMCIRDRRHCSRRCRIYRRNGPAGTPEALLEGSGGTPLGSPVPVSYTHLTLPTICSV